MEHKSLVTNKFVAISHQQTSALRGKGKVGLLGDGAGFAGTVAIARPRYCEISQAIAIAQPIGNGCDNSTNHERIFHMIGVRGLHTARLAIPTQTMCDMG